MFLSVKFRALTHSQGEGELLGLRKKALAGEPSPPGSPGGFCPSGGTSGEALAMLSGGSPQTQVVPAASTCPTASLTKEKHQRIALGTLGFEGQTPNAQRSKTTTDKPCEDGPCWPSSLELLTATGESLSEPLKSIWSCSVLLERLEAAATPGSSLAFP